MSFFDRLRVRRLPIDGRNRTHRIGLREPVTFLRKEDAACCNERRDDDGRLPIGFCSATCERRADAGAVNLLVVVMAFVLGLAIVVTIILFGEVDDHATKVDATAPAPARDLAETTSTTTTSTTTTTVAVLEQRIEQHYAAQAAPVGTRTWTWDYLADCESGEWDARKIPIAGTARWDDRRGGYEGGVHFAPSTWDGFRDADMPDAAYLASREVQIVVAERVLAEQGPGAWPECSYKVGMR